MFRESIRVSGLNFYPRIVRQKQLRLIDDQTNAMDTGPLASSKLIVVLLIAPIGIIYGQMFGIQVPNKCHDVCPTRYRVVCALSDGCLRTFASSCVMRMYNCKYQKNYRIISQRACEFISNEELQKLEL